MYGYVGCGGCDSFCVFVRVSRIGKSESRHKNGTLILSDIS